MVDCSSRRRLLQIQTCAWLLQPLNSHSFQLMYFIDWWRWSSSIMAVFAFLGGDHSLFLSLGWCHSLCTMAFHYLGIKNLVWGYAHASISFLISLLIFGKLCWAGLLEELWFGYLIVFQEDAFYCILIVFLLLFFPF